MFAALTLRLYPPSPGALFAGLRKRRLPDAVDGPGGACSPQPVQLPSPRAEPSLHTRRLRSQFGSASILIDWPGPVERLSVSGDDAAQGPCLGGACQMSASRGARREPRQGHEARAGPRGEKARVVEARMPPMGRLRTTCGAWRWRKRNAQCVWRNAAAQCERRGGRASARGAAQAA